MERVKVGDKDFEIIAVLGEGGYGKVTLMRKVTGWDNGRLYAIKRMRKTTNMKRMGYFLNERHVLEQVRDKPFLATLHYAFETDKDLNFVLDYVRGGDMLTQMLLHGSLSEAHVKFYVGELVLALQHLHKLKIVHRDIKPENILIDSGGHVVLTDFGFSKFVSSEKDENCDPCGTIRYLAPEVIKCSQGKRPGYPVDWWALGVVTFEFLTGHSPFASHGDEDSTEDVFRRILKNAPLYPSTMSLNSRDFVKALLRTDPSKRLGAHGAGELKKNLFFNGLRWKDLEQKKIPAPFVPRLKNDLDLSNFDKEFTNMAIEESAEITSDSNNLCTLTHSSSKLLEGFPYVATAIHVTKSPECELLDTGRIEPRSATAKDSLVPRRSNCTSFNVCRSELSPRCTPCPPSHSVMSETRDTQLRRMSKSLRGLTINLGFTIRKGSDGLSGSTDCTGFVEARSSSSSGVTVHFIVGCSSSISLTSTSSSNDKDVNRSRTHPRKDMRGGEHISATSDRATTISTIGGRALTPVSHGACPRGDEKAGEVESAVGEHDVDHTRGDVNIMAAVVSCKRRREKKRSVRKSFTLPSAVFGCIKR